MPSPLVDTLVSRHSLTLLCGPSNAGKSILLAQLLAVLQRGQSSSYLGYTVSSGLRTGFIAGDAQAWVEYEQRFEAAGAYPDVERTRRRLEPQPGHQPWHHFLDVLDSLPHCDLIIVEGLGGLTGGERLNIPHATTDRFNELRRWLENHNTGMVGTHHLNKLDKPVKRPIDRVMGSGTITGNCSSTLILEVPLELGQPYHRLTVYSRTHPDHAVWLKQLPDLKGFEIAPDPAQDAPESTITQQKVLDLIPPAGISTGALVEQMGTSRQRVHQVLEELMISDQVRKDRRGHYIRIG